MKARDHVRAFQQQVSLDNRYKSCSVSLFSAILPALLLSPYALPLASTQCLQVLPYTSKFQVRFFQLLKEPLNPLHIQVSLPPSTFQASPTFPYKYHHPQMHVLRCPTMHLTFPTSFLAPPLLSKPMTVTLAAQGPASKILYKQFLPQAPKKCSLGKHTNGSSFLTIPAVRQQKSNYLNVSLGIR